MFERFTDRARRVVVLAGENARKHNHDSIRLRHLIIALIEEGEGVAAVVLRELGYTVESQEALLASEMLVGAPQERHIPIPFTEASKRTLELALREALQLGHNYIGTEHILLGLIRNKDAEHIFPDKEGTVVRKAVIEKLASYTPETRPADTVAQIIRRAVASIARAWDDLPRLKRLEVLTELLDSSDPEDRAWIRRFLDDTYDRNGDAS